MAITDSRLKIVLRYTIAGQKAENVMWYRPDGAAFLTADAAAVAEAYWNDIKTVWRAMIVNTSFFDFDSVFVSESSPTGAFGEYAVPLAEKVGTRSGTGLGEFLPAFNAVGVRLTVASRTTRPGQKRFPGLTEGDNNSGQITSTFEALVNAVAGKYSSQVNLGVPVATGVLNPIIVRLAGDPRVPVADQDVIGHFINPNITSQVSRKPGRGQ